MKIVAVDIGTSRIKAALFSPDGEMSMLVSKRLPRAASPDSQDAEEWYCCTCELLKKITEKEKPEGVVLTGNMHALLGVDKEGIPVENAVLWSDNSAIRESDMLNKKYGRDLLETFGNSSIPVFTLPKILKMKQERFSLYRKTEKFLQSKDFILYRLTGNAVTDPTDASGTLLMDRHTNSWSERFCTELDIDKRKLPDILPSASICGKITEKAAVETGLLCGTPVVTGCGDLSSAALGSGVNEETFSLTLGTAGQLLAAGKNNASKLAGRIFVFAHADPSLELYLGSVPAGGFSFEYLANLHNITTEEFFIRAAAVSQTEDLPIFLPYILGKGAPYMDYESNGAWFRLKGSHTLSHICRGAVFGTLAALYQSCEMLQTFGVPGNHLILQALACREKVVMDTANTLFPQKKYLPENSEASLLGAAITGFTALDKAKTFSQYAEDMIKKSPVVPAQENECRIAEHLYELYCQYAQKV